MGFLLKDSLESFNYIVTHLSDGKSALFEFGRRLEEATLMGSGPGNDLELDTGVGVSGKEGLSLPVGHPP